MRLQYGGQASSRLLLVYPLKINYRRRPLITGCSSEIRILTLFIFGLT